MIVLGVLYFIIFHKHHKRNKIELSELVSLVTKFYSLTTLVLIIIALGIYCIIEANSYKEDRNDVIIHVSGGIMIISISIIYYISYIKKSLMDLDQSVREKNKKRDKKIGEIHEIIFFTIFLLTPIWRIAEFINLFNQKNKLIIEILKSFVLSITAIILMYEMNPINIKEKITKLLKRDRKVKNEKIENVNQENEIENNEDKKDENINQENEKDKNINKKMKTKKDEK